MRKVTTKQVLHMWFWIRRMLVMGFIIIPILTLFQVWLMFFADPSTLPPEDQLQLADATWYEKLMWILFFLCFWGGLNTIIFVSFSRYVRKLQRNETGSDLFKDGRRQDE